MDKNPYFPGTPGWWQSSEGQFSFDQSLFRALQYLILSLMAGFLHLRPCHSFVRMSKKASLSSVSSNVWSQIFLCFTSFPPEPLKLWDVFPKNDTFFAYLSTKDIMPTQCCHWTSGQLATIITDVSTNFYHKSYSYVSHLAILSSLTSNTRLCSRNAGFPHSTLWMGTVSSLGE